jgi:hypothetical protein
MYLGKSRFSYKGVPNWSTIRRGAFMNYMNFEFGDNKKWKGVGKLDWKVMVGKAEGKFSLCLKTDNFYGVDGKYCIKVSLLHSRL